MDPLRYRVIAKHIGFSDEMIHIRDNCFMFKDKSFVDIVLEHDDSLECHGFSRSCVKDCTLKHVLEQPVFKSADDNLVNILQDTVRDRTIAESSCYKQLREICRRWDGNHYIHKLYCGRFASVYGFVYSIAGGNPIVYLQAVNYSKRDMSGSFAIDADIIKSVYEVLVV